jgi:hypothetical protein
MQADKLLAKKQWNIAADAWNNFIEKHKDSAGHA